MYLFRNYDRDETVGGGRVNVCVKGVSYGVLVLIPKSTRILSWNVLKRQSVSIQLQNNVRIITKSVLYHHQLHTLQAEDLCFRCSKFVLAEQSRRKHPAQLCNLFGNPTASSWAGLASTGTTVDAAVLGCT